MRKPIESVSLTLMCVILACSAGCSNAGSLQQASYKPSIKDDSSMESSLDIDASGNKRIFSPELEVFMEEINQEHRVIEKPKVDYSLYAGETRKKYLNLGLYYVGKGEAAEGYEDKVFTIGQAEAELNLLFLILQANYGPYNYFGGDETFLAAKELVLQDCRAAKVLTGRILLDSLVNHLSFIQDAHFYIDKRTLSDFATPFIYKETSFEKMESGYRTWNAGEENEQRKIVDSVEGWKDLNELFKRSISEDGRIVYYPVVMKTMKQEDVYEKGKEESITPEDLVVHYTDGSIQRLQSKAYEPYGQDTAKDIEIYDNDGVPVVFMRRMYDEVSDAAKQFISSAERFRETPVMIVDLRENRGGYTITAARWMEKYTEHRVSTNVVSIRLGNPDNLSLSLKNNDIKSYISDKSFLDTAGFRAISECYVEKFSQPDVFVDNEELLIILTSKNTASAAEIFTDMAHNVKNVLIIGENSTGCMFGTSSVLPLKLTYTQMILGFGETFSIFPEDDTYFQEFRGLEPDLWVNAGEAEELAIKFINYYMEQGNQ